MPASSIKQTIFQISEDDRFASMSERGNLSVREHQVMTRLSKGHTYKGIAFDLGVSLDTVRTYLRRSYGKLGVHSRTDAVVQFLTQANRAT